MSLVKFKKLIPVLVVISLLASCTNTVKLNTVQHKYDKGVQEYDRGYYANSIETFKNIIEENPGTRYANYSYLKIADAYFATGSSKYTEAELNYRIFLAQNENSHLVPYVLARLISLNFKKNEHWFFGKYYDYDRDPEPYKRIISEYQRFYLLYPESAYLKDTKLYLNKSVQALAQHEFSIGKWYYEHSFYLSAISRYKYLLRNYPNYEKADQAVEELIKAYYKNQRPDLAEELKQVLKNK